MASTLGNLRSAGCAALLVLSFTLWQSLISTGIVYGWPALLLLLKEEGVYSSMCPPSDDNCSARVVAFNFVFSIGGAVNVAGGILCGFYVDTVGPRAGIISGFLLLILGSLAMALSETSWDAIWPCAYALYGMGGCCAHLSTFSLGNAFGKAKGLVISCLVCMFSISSLTFQAFDLLYNAGVTRQALFLAHVVLQCLNIILSYWLWPAKVLLPGDALLLSGGRPQLAPKSDSQSSGAPLTRNASSRFRDTLRIACTAKFVCFLFFHSSQLFINRCLMGWMSSELRWKDSYLRSTGRDGIDVDVQLGIFNFTQALLGFLAIPCFGALVARKGHRYAPFVATSFLSVAYLSIRPFAEPMLLPVLYFVSACHRQFFFSTFFTYLISEYPPELFATLTGIASLLAGLGSLLQTPLLDFVLRRLEGDLLTPLLAQLGMAVLVFFLYLQAWCRASDQDPPDEPVHHTQGAPNEAEVKSAESPKLVEL